MASFVIEGGHSLSGDIYPQGAKNEVLQIICATLLTAEEVTVHNIPDILDVNNLIQLMRDMGVNVSKKGIDTYSFQAANVDFAYLESDEFLKRCSSLRGSVMLVGPMVARFGKAMISKPGGEDRTPPFGYTFHRYTEFRSRLCLQRKAGSLRNIRPAVAGKLYVAGRSICNGNRQYRNDGCTGER